MYRIYADDTLIYDSTLEDYKIGKGQITREADKSGSFVFSVYPDHPYYGQFVQMRTVITVYKSGRIVFRGRILDDAVDYWNVKTLTCEGELGFLQDSVARPFSFQGDHADLFAQFIAEHNDQVDDWKKFKVGTVTVEDSNEYVNRSAGGYGAMLDTMQSALTGSELGGHFYITHGDDGTDPIPTLHYVADFPKTASQGIEFGVNLKDYTKKVSAADLATCIIPLGASTGSDGERLTIEAKNGGKDYIYDANAVAMYGWIVKVVTWDDVTLDNHLLTKGRAWLAAAVNQHATIELTAIDMHLLDRSMESYNVCEYVRATSKPHGLDALMLCSKQTMDLLRPDNDTVTLGYSFGTMTSASVKLGASVSTLGKTMSSIKQEAGEIAAAVEKQGESLTKLELLPGQMTLSVENGTDGTSASIQLMMGDEKLGQPAEIKLTGVVTFEGLANGTTTVDGSCIKTGTIDADRINLSGAITFGHLDAELQEKVNASGGISEDDAADIISTYIDEWRVSSPRLEGSEIYGGAYYDSKGYGELTLSYTSGSFTYPVLSFTDTKNDVSLLSVYPVKYVSAGIAASLEMNDVRVLSVFDDGTVRVFGDWNFAGATVSNLDIDISEIVTTDNLYLEGDGASLTIGDGGSAYIWAGGHIFPDGDGYCCGNNNYPWSIVSATDVYADGVPVTSDRNRKHDINYDLNGYDALFDALRPVGYKLNNGTSGRVHIGMIAQEVENAVALCGMTGQDFGAVVRETAEDGTERYYLRYMEFIGLLIDQVQKLKARVASLEGTA